MTVRFSCLVQPQQPIDEQLSQLKIAARDKINELVDSSKQQFDSARNDPTNRYVVYYCKTWFHFCGCNSRPCNSLH